MKSDDELWFQAYCAALTGILAGEHEGSPADYADRAIDALERRRAGENDDAEPPA